MRRYVADDSTQQILKFNGATGALMFTYNSTTLGLGSTPFYYPDAVYVDSNNMIYIGDTGNNRILKVSQTGVVTAFLTNIPSLLNLKALTVDSTGVIYIADSAGNSVIKLLSNYTAAYAASLFTSTVDMPYDVAGDASGNIYVTVPNNGTVFKYAANGTLLQRFSYPGLQGVNGVAVDTAGNVYISNTTSPAGSVIKFNNAGAYQQTFAMPAGQTGLQYPWGVAVDSSMNVYVADTVGQQVVKFSPAGIVLLQITQPAGSYPNQIALDTSGNVYVADDSTFQILKFNGATGTLLFTYNSTTLGLTKLGLQYPGGVYVDGNNFIYIADTSNNRVLKVTQAGVVSQIFTATVNQAVINNAKSVYVDNNGVVYVADLNNKRVVKFGTTGSSPVTVASSTGSPASSAMSSSSSSSSSAGAATAIITPIPSSTAAPAPGKSGAATVLPAVMLSAVLAILSAAALL